MNRKFTLGTCAIAAFSDEEVSTALKLQKEEEPLYIMPIGYYDTQVQD